MRIAKLKNYLKSKNVTDNLINIIPSICDCGYELEVNDELTALSCSNALCPIHMAARMESMLKNLNVKNIGRSICAELIERNSYIHHTQIFTITLDDFPDRFSIDYRTKLYNEIMDKKPKTFGEVLRACEFSGFDTRALTLGKGYASADDFYKDYNYDIQFIKDKLNIKKDATPNMINRTLIENEQVIRLVSSWFTLVKEADFTLKIAMTGAIKTVTREDGSKYSPRETFIKEMRDLYRESVHITLASTVTQDVNFLISDSISPHGKYKQATSLGIPIITCLEFKKILEKASNIE